MLRTAMGLFSKLFKGKDGEDVESADAADTTGEAGASPPASEAEVPGDDGLDDDVDVDVELDADGEISGDSEEIELGDLEPPTEAAAPKRSVTEAFEVDEVNGAPSQPAPKPEPKSVLPTPPKIGPPPGPGAKFAPPKPPGLPRSTTGKWSAAPPPVHAKEDGPTLAPGLKRPATASKPVPPVKPPKPAAPKPVAAKPAPPKPASAKPVAPKVPAVSPAGTPPQAGVPSPVGQAAKEDSGFIDALLDEADAAFDALGDEDAGDTTGKLEIDDGQLEELHGLFKELAANHVVALRELAFELRAGEVPRRWITGVRPAVKAVVAAAEQVGVTDLKTGLEALDEVLATAAKDTAPSITGDRRNEILAQYDRLSGLMPDSFGSDSSLRAREEAVVEVLFSDVQGLHALAVERLRGAGLGSLSKLYVAKAEDVASIGHVPRQCANDLVSAVGAFKRDRDTLGPDAAKQWRKRLAGFAEELEARQAAFAEADRLDDFTGRRAARRAREQMSGQIRLALTHLDERGLADTLAQEPVARQVERVRDYLDDAQVRARTAMVS